MSRTLTTVVPDEIHDRFKEILKERGDNACNFLKNAVYELVLTDPNSATAAKSKQARIEEAIGNAKTVTLTDIRLKVATKVKDSDILNILVAKHYTRVEGTDTYKQPGKFSIHRVKATETETEPESVEECKTSLVDPERICEMGTKGCKVRHSALPSTATDE